MDNVKIKNTRVIIQHADIVNLLVDVVVSPDSNDFFMSRGAARAIAKASGIRAREVLKFDKPIKVGDAVITQGGSLPAKNIIHLAFMETDALEFDRVKVGKAICSALRLADEKKFVSLGMPVFTSSVNLFPYDMCAKIMLNAIFSYLMENNSCIQVVTVAVYDHEALESFLRAFRNLKESYML